MSIIGYDGDRVGQICKLDLFISVVMLRRLLTGDIDVGSKLILCRLGWSTAERRYLFRRFRFHFRLRCTR